MRSLTTTEHQLEIRTQPRLSFVPADAGMYYEARKLAYAGRIFDAIDNACETRIENYGDMHGVSFRVVTKSKTVTFEGPIDDGMLQ